MFTITPLPVGVSEVGFTLPYNTVPVVVLISSACVNVDVVLLVPEFIYLI